MRGCSWRAGMHTALQSTGKPSLVALVETATFLGATALPLPCKTIGQGGKGGGDGQGVCDAWPGLQLAHCLQRRKDQPAAGRAGHSQCGGPSVLTRGGGARMPPPESGVRRPPTTPRPHGCVRASPPAPELQHTTSASLAWVSEVKRPAPPSTIQSGQLHLPWRLPVPASRSGGTAPVNPHVHSRHRPRCH